MQFKSEMVQDMYLNSPLPKDKISPRMLKEIAEAFCIRNSCKIETLEVDGEIGFVTVSGVIESLELLEDFRLSFEDMGYSGILLEVTDIQ